jgi:hypothetical protein
MSPDFYKLWEMLQGVQTHHGTPDVITWKFGENGIYSASSAYRMQFLGHYVSYALNGLETVRSSKMQELFFLGKNARALIGLSYKTTFGWWIGFIEGVA